MANELPFATTADDPITLICGASNVGDSLLVTNPSAFVVTTAQSTYIAGVTCGAATALLPALVYKPGCGTISLTAGGVIAAGDALTFGPAGKCVKRTAGSGQAVIGYARSAATGDGVKFDGVITESPSCDLIVEDCGAANMADALLAIPGASGFTVAGATPKFLFGVTVGAATASTPALICPVGSKEMIVTTTAAAVAVGDELTCATGGKVVKQATTETTYGVALSAVGAGGGTIRARMFQTPISNAS